MYQPARRVLVVIMRQLWGRAGWCGRHNSESLCIIRCCSRSSALSTTLQVPAPQGSQSEPCHPMMKSIRLKCALSSVNSIICVICVLCPTIKQQDTRGHTLEVPSCTHTHAHAQAVSFVNGLRVEALHMKRTGQVLQQHTSAWHGSRESRTALTKQKP